MGKAIYCISGLGADEKIFANLQVAAGYELIHIPWTSPENNDTIETYAARMASLITEEAAIVLGVSFGGMIGIEIARQRPLQKLILVSSIKSFNELPRWMRVAGRLKLNKFLPTKSFKFTEKIDNNRLGVSSIAERDMVRAYRQAADQVYLRWAINEILNWKNDWAPENIVHIHGGKDRIFPASKIKAAHIINGATHMMIYNRGADISAIINKELENK